jgi:hypothetical protein
MTALALASGGKAIAQDVCTNIRLSVSEQIECRGRVNSALGDADRLRVQQDFEERIRRAQDQLITPPALRSNPPSAIRVVPNAVPSVGTLTVPRSPTAPETPTLPGALNSGTSSATTSPGEIAKPGGTPPSGSALVPDLTAPNPNRSPLPPISPLPVNPAGSLPPSE